ncbi:MAG: hypothetical protein C0429_16040 [Sphingopyxis sp.]|nr:hypothetical protein [Sphingopyxis sp.]
MKPETMRNFLKTGLLCAPGRAAANHRADEGEHLARPAIIRRARSLSYGFEAVHKLLRFADDLNQP